MDQEAILWLTWLYKSIILGESGIIGQHTNPPPAWPLTQSVTFNSPFEQTPTVTYGLYLLDAGSNANLRVATEVSSITTTGFQIKINKWADTV